MSTDTLRLRAGDLIEVKNRDEILATLDSSGCLDGMPFMPEMLSFCGQRIRVAKVAHKTCDTKCKSGGRSISACVHLENSRCDGTGHDGCQARCNLFWKTAWLRTADAPMAPPREGPTGRCSEAELVRATRTEAPDGTRYRCQATQIVEASEPLAWWDPRQYLRDITSGNASAGHVIKILVLSWFGAWRRYGFPYRLSRWVYDKAHRVIMGRQSPYLPKNVSYPAKASAGELGLTAGERVRIKPHPEIRATLNAASRHRGLWFDAEMVPFCGGEYTVTQRVERIINERTGEMMQMKGPCIMLDGVACRAEYSDRRLFCPRAIPPYWREIWLERVEPKADKTGSNHAATSGK